MFELILGECKQNPDPQPCLLYKLMFMDQIFCVLIMYKTPDPDLKMTVFRIQIHNNALLTYSGEAGELFLKVEDRKFDEAELQLGGLPPLHTSLAIEAGKLENRFQAGTRSLGAQ